MGIRFFMIVAIPSLPPKSLLYCSNTIPQALNLGHKFLRTKRVLVKGENKKIPHAVDSFFEIFQKGGDYMKIERRPAQPESVVGLNNTSFPENPGSGATATEKLPTVALAANAAPQSFRLRTALEVMDWEGGAQLPTPIGKENGNKI